MSYASDLSDDAFLVIYEDLYQRAQQAAQAAYRESPRKAGESFCFPSVWSELLKGWCENVVTNQRVREYLQRGIETVDGIEIPPSYLIPRSTIRKN